MARVRDVHSEVNVVITIAVDESRLESDSFDARELNRTAKDRVRRALNNSRVRTEFNRLGLSLEYSYGWPNISHSVSLGPHDDPAFDVVEEEPDEEEPEAEAHAEVFDPEPVEADTTRPVEIDGEE